MDYEIFFNAFDRQKNIPNHAYGSVETTKMKGKQVVGNTCHPADSVLSWLLPPPTTLATVLIPLGCSTDFHRQGWKDGLCLLLNATIRIIQDGRTSGGLYFNLLLQGGSAVRSDQVVQGFIQSGLETLQGWRVTVLLLWATCSSS